VTPHSLALLASTGPDSLEINLRDLLVLAVISAAVPMIVGLLRLKVAEVVLLLGFGVLVGPSGLNLITYNSTMDTFNEVGLGLLFFLAGYELEQRAIQGQSGRLAAIGWFTSFGISLLVVWFLWQAEFVTDYMGVAIALTSTALGTLLPVIRDRGLLNTRFGLLFMGAGAAGEFGPILAIALLLGSSSIGTSILILGAFALVGLLAYYAPMRLATERVRELLRRGHMTSSQTAVRWTVVLLLLLLVVASRFGLDAVLGAFVAGVILHRFVPPETDNELIPKIEGLGFGFFIPLFFILSGVKLDVASIVAHPMRLLVFFLLLLLVRGVPQFLLYRYALPDTRERLQFMLYVATGLPILVAITTLEMNAGIMRAENGAALVGAGALSVLVFPLLGDYLNRAARARDSAESLAAE
jgi:Kef-type K+ transport system membrane component KefB